MKDLWDGYHLDHLERALAFVADWSLAVDGGAHRGIWTQAMADRFERVVAIEPVPANADRIPSCGATIVRAALGEAAGRGTMRPGRNNTGQWHVGPGDEIDVITLDSLDLPSCGFLKLDVEGSELAALRGAERTIRRCCPVILVEQNACAARYGLPETAAQSYLEGLGYRLRDRVGEDFILTC